MPTISSGYCRGQLRRYARLRNSSDSPNEAVVLTQGGVIYRIALDGSARPLFGDVSSLLIANPGSEEGFWASPSPNFATDARSSTTAPAIRGSVLARFNVANGAMDMGSEPSS
jgi:hypothetical protein